ncbi:MAG TPA: PaaI family thioesterase [Candidatus Anoxymicrobiaceae bacterium]
MELDENTRESFREILNNSPMYCHMKMQVVDAGEGRSRVEMQADKTLHSLYGMLHGGAVATIMDSSCGIALGSLLEPGEICVTIDLRINYVSNLREGTLIGEGRVIHRGKKTGVTEAEIRDSSGNLIAAGMATHLVCDPGDVRMADFHDPGE